MKTSFNVVEDHWSKATMYATLDIFVNRHDESDSWIVSPRTLMDLNDPQEDWDDRNYVDEQFVGGNRARTRALRFAVSLAESAVKLNQTRQAVVFLEGNEYSYHSKAVRNIVCDTDFGQGNV